VIRAFLQKHGIGTVAFGVPGTHAHRILKRERENRPPFSRKGKKHFSACKLKRELKLVTGQGGRGGGTRADHFTGRGKVDVTRLIGWRGGTRTMTSSRKRGNGVD